MKPNTRTLILAVLVTLLVGILIGRWWSSPRQQNMDMSHPEVTEQAGTNEWTCSMHPQIRQHEPGKCPICGMDLIPVGNLSGEENPLEISMSPTAMQLANIQTEVIRSGQAEKEIRVIGKAQADERRIFSQVTHLEGRIESLEINFTGEPVAKGQTIATIYSPNLVTAQQELFTAYSLRTTQPALFEAAREKLKNWKISDAEIDAILTEGKPRESFPITADVGGLVLTKKVNLGDYVMRGMPLYDVVDLKQIWVLFDIYEQDLNLVHVGSKIEFTFQSIPGQNYAGKISFMDPVIDPMTRSAKARVEVPNNNGLLKPEMFASGLMRIPVGSRQNQIVIPSSAVLWTGERSLVYVKNPDSDMPSFQMHEITLGSNLGNEYLVKAGLETGMEIVVNGTFAVDAAAQLAGKPSMMSPRTIPASRMDTIPRLTEVPPAFHQAIGAILTDYLVLKDDLVSGNATNAPQILSQLYRKAEELPVDAIKGDASSIIRNQIHSFKQILKRMQDNNQLADLRVQFKPLSKLMIDFATAFGPFEQPVFVQHCPMADQNKGADWLSVQKNIRNPYFGDAMLTCGSTIREIND